MAKRNAAKLSAIACKALGLVFGHALSEGTVQPVFTYGKRWLIVTACIGFAFLIAMVIEYIIRKFYFAPISPADGGEAMSSKQSAERYFSVGRSRIARSVVLVYIVSVFASVSISGSATIFLIVMPFGLLMAADTYISLNSAGQHFKASVVGSLFSGVVYGFAFWRLMGLP